MKSASSPIEVIARDYAEALAFYVTDRGEAALTRAYELGRRAASEGVGVLQIADIYHRALEALPSNETGELPIERAAEFFAESLSPFEMTLRAYQANARLLGLSETLAQQNAEIDRAREQLRTILDATTALIYLKDAEGRYLFVNRQFQQLFGLPREVVIGKLEREILPLRVAEALGATDTEVLAAAKPRELEETVPGEDGPLTYLSLKFPLLDAAGAPYALCCVATDITERKRADTALRRAKEAAEVANRELESFSYSVAHDLRAPLRRIDGFSKVLLEDWAHRLDAEGRKYLQYVRESAQEMAHLIDDLLTLSRISRRELVRRQVDLSELARSIGERLQASDPGRAVELVVQEEIFADGDRHLLRAALENLMGNAWKFTAKSSAARIEFGAKLRDRPVIYFVRDNGAGFDTKYAGKLFGVFERLHSSEEFEGTGIGLATVQRIVDRHGGRVWAEGEVSRGATFFFTLEGENRT